MKVYQGLEELIGKTPLLECKRFAEKTGALSRIAIKLESKNPAGSAKDRVALQMLRSRIDAGDFPPGSTVIEPTSGNTGVGLAALGAALGYRVILTMPENMSVERQMLLKAYGAEIFLTPAAEGMEGAIRKAAELKALYPNAYLPGQFTSPDNPEAHYRTTGPEIWEDTEGVVSIFVSAVGTGGTLTGCARYLKEKNPQIKVVGVEPAGSPVLSGGKRGPHGIQGIGAGFIPEVLDPTLMDEILTVTEEEAYEHSRLLAQCEGILAGISSGAALAAAVRVAKREENRGKFTVVILPDTGERYLSTPLFSK